MIVSAAWLAPALLGAVNEIAQLRIRGEPALDVSAILFGAGDWLIYAALTPIVFVFAQRLPLLRPRLARNAAIHLTLALAFSALWAGLCTLLKGALVPEGLWGDLRTHFTIWLFITLPVGVAIYFGLVGTEHGVRYFAEAKERRIAMAELSGQLSSARLAALQSRVNPHFLFNTLNTIAVLVRDGDQRSATRIIELLSDLLRRTLDTTAHEVSLGRELQLVNDYLEIERARFSDRLETRIEAGEAVRSALVPALAVQHLVENAVRHGVGRQPAGGTVTVVARRNGDVVEIAVLDDGPGLDSAGEPSGHGLNNTRERLHALYGEAASLAVENRSGGGVGATLRIPFREAVASKGREREDG